MKKLILSSFIILSSAVFSQAGDTSSEPNHVTAVSWILSTRNNSDVDDKHVVLVGRLTGQDGDDWWFNDGTGSVRLTTGDKELPVGPKLIIYGVINHVDFGIFGHLEVEVKRWEYADKTKHSFDK